MSFKNALAISLAAFALSGCGGGFEPLSILGETDQPVLLGFPFSSNAGVSLQSVGVDGSYNYAAPTTVAVVAPANGVVAQVDGATVVLYHSANLSTRLQNFVTTKRVGDYVRAGEALGTPNGVTPVNLHVVANGALACPYIHGSTAFRTSIVLPNPPCQNI